MRWRDPTLIASAIVVCAANANPATTLAARELHTWFKQSTGIELPQATLSAPMTQLLVERIRAEVKIGMQGGYLYKGQCYE